MTIIIKWMMAIDKLLDYYLFCQQIFYQIFAKELVRQQTILQIYRNFFLLQYDLIFIISYMMNIPNISQIHLSSLQHSTSLTENKVSVQPINRAYHSEHEYNQEKPNNNNTQIYKIKQGNKSQEHIIEHQKPQNNQQSILQNKSPIYFSQIILNRSDRPSSLRQRQIEVSHAEDKAKTQVEYQRKINKMPESVMLMIRSLAKGKKIEQKIEPKIQSMEKLSKNNEEQQQRPQISRSIFKKYKELRMRNKQQNMNKNMNMDTEKKFICQICACQYKQSQKANISNGRCEHYFCDSCLRHYVDYKLAKFQQIFCPAEQCKQQMDNTTQFFNSLSDVQKQKHKKIVKFYTVAKDPNIRLCPDQSCEDGILKIGNIQDQQQQLKCTKCNKKYCKKCFLPEHSGKCDRNEVNFFQNNLHYRQCSSCKKIVEKSQGCNHITCICGYQFCYLCGRKWTGYNHKCSVMFNTIMRSYQCFQNCSELGGQGVMGTILRTFIKIFIGTPFYILLLIALLLKSILITVIFFIITLAIGPTFYACRFLCDCGGFCCCFFLIFFPVAMVIGLGAAFCDLFVEIFLDAWIGFIDEVKEVTLGVYEW